MDWRDEVQKAEWSRIWCLLRARGGQHKSRGEDTEVSLGHGECEGLRGHLGKACRTLQCRDVVFTVADMSTPGKGVDETAWGVGMGRDQTSWSCNF